MKRSRNKDSSLASETSSEPIQLLSCPLRRNVFGGGTKGKVMKMMRFFTLTHHHDRKKKIVPHPPLTDLSHYAIMKGEWLQLLIFKGAFWCFAKLVSQIQELPEKGFFCGLEQHPPNTHMLETPVPGMYFYKCIFFQREKAPLRLCSCITNLVTMVATMKGRHLKIDREQTRAKCIIAAKKYIHQVKVNGAKRCPAAQMMTLKILIKIFLI